MKRLCSAIAIALAFSAGSALAADLPAIKGPPPPLPPPPPMWTGFYAGVNLGGTWNASNNVYTIASPAFADFGFPHGVAADTPLFLGAASTALSAFSSSNWGGFIGGGQIGYNWQFATSFVAGIEADIQGVAGSNGNNTVITAAPVGIDSNGNFSNYVGAVSVRKRLDYIGTVRGRLGWLFTPTLLVYGTGGLAYGGVQLRSAAFAVNDFYVADPTLGGFLHLTPLFGGANFSDTRIGWTAGGGLEWMFMPNWSAKVEYLYYDLGSVTSFFVTPHTDNVTGLNAAFTGQTRARFNGNIVRVGVNYHFNWGAPPVVARY